MPIELHCHTLFSVDGHGTPEAVVEAAAARGVSLLSVTDHNNLGSCRRAALHAQKHGIRYLPGVEFDAIWNGRQLHFLGLGPDPENAELERLCRRHLEVYSQFVGLVRKALEERGFPVSDEELSDDYAERYRSHPSPTPNLWHLREFYSKEGRFPDPALADETFQEVSREIKERHAAGSKGFASLEEVSRTVRQAGGVVLLAHVARYLPGDAAGQIGIIEELLGQGVDGFELYHPKNCAELHFEELRLLAERRRCLISGGSDSHSSPGTVGECGAPEAIVGPLLEEIELRSRESKASRRPEPAGPVSPERRNF